MMKPKKKEEYPDDNPSFNKIIQIYTTTKDPSLLNFIVPKYNGLIWKLLADIIKNTGLESKVLEKRDLYMSGITGFIEALGKYDPSVGVRITSWTAPRVVGAIFDELRNFDLLGRKGRSDFKRYNNTMKENNLDDIDEMELTEAMGVSLSELRQIASLAFMEEISMDSILPNDRGDKPLNFGDTLEVINAVDDYRSITPIDKFYFNERSEKIIEAIKKLDKDERRVFRSYYFQNMTIKQIGSSRILGRELSESRVSQIFTLAQQKIVAYIGKHDSELSNLVRQGFRNNHKEFSRLSDF